MIILGQRTEQGDKEGVSGASGGSWRWRLLFILHRATRVKTEYLGKKLLVLQLFNFHHFRCVC